MALNPVALALAGRAELARDVSRTAIMGDYVLPLRGLLDLRQQALMRLISAWASLRLDGLSERLLREIAVTHIKPDLASSVTAILTVDWTHRRCKAVPTSTMVHVGAIPAVGAEG